MVKSNAGDTGLIPALERIPALEKEIGTYSTGKSYGQRSLWAIVHRL